MKAFFINLELDKKNRYDFSKFLSFSDSYDPLTSVFLQKLQDVRVGGSYRITGNEGRPDRISFDIYDSFQYWWIIMEYNEVLRNEDLVSGLVLYYPEEQALEDLYFSLKALEVG